MAEPMRSESRKYTYADRLSWPENERWELIDGVAYAMTPAPTFTHQKILRRLNRQFDRLLKDSPCELITSPFDVLLPSASEDEMTAQTVVQPDLIVICDTEKLHERGCIGSPTLVVEILSRYSKHMDLNKKLHLYECSGVPEYWVVSPSDYTILVYTRNAQGQYDDPRIFEYGDQVPVGVLPGLMIDLIEVFER